MAWTFEDKFNSDTKSTGNLNGQDGWSGDTLFQIVNTDSLEGDQSIYTASDADVSYTMTHTGMGCSSGTVYVGMAWSQISDTNGKEFNIYFKDTSDNIGFIVGIRNDSGTARIFYFDGSYHYLSEATINTWYIFAVQWEANNGGSGVHQWKVKWKEQGGIWSEFTGWLEDFQNTDGTIDKMVLYTSAKSWHAYWDTFTPTDPDPDATGLTNLKTINNLAKASVKTVNGLAIASIKTINNLA